MPAFEVKTLHGCVVVFRFLSDPTGEDLVLFKQCYQKVYAKYPHFVLVFDLYAMGLPPQDLLASVGSLILSMKYRTSRQVLAAMVLTSHSTLRDLVLSLVRAGGQAAPFMAFTSRSELAAATARCAGILKGWKAVSHPRKLAKPLRWKDFSDKGFALCIVKFMQSMRHFLRQGIEVGVPLHRA